MVCLPEGLSYAALCAAKLVCDRGLESFFCAHNPHQIIRVLEIPHYALLLFALLMSLFTARCMLGSECNGGRCNLDIGLGLAKQASRAKGLAQSPGTRHLLELKVSLCCGALRYLGLPERLVNFPGFPKMMQQNG
jgi:hypothetical protein